MKFSKLSEYFSKIESTSSRNEITEILAALLRKSSKEEIDLVCYLSLGRLAPLYEGIEFNLAEKMMVRIIARAFNKDEEEVKKLYKKAGDLGEVGEGLAKGPPSPRLRRVNARKKGLGVQGVYDKLRQIAEVSGSGSQEKKVKWMAKLLQELDPLSTRYVVRIPLGKLRLGFSELTILDSLSWMIAGDKSKREEIESAFNVRADIGQIAQLVKEKGMRGVAKTQIELGVPIVPALCQRLPTAEKIIEKVGNAAVEPKYDGTRLQIHFSKKKKWEGEEAQLDLGLQPEGFVQSSPRSNSQFRPPVGFVRTFTRNLENTTHMFPDLIEAVFKEVKAQEAILDCEAIGVDPKTGKFLPFQETMKRKRKYGIGKKAKEIPLKFFCFDILFKDGKSLLTVPFSKRRKILENALSPKNETLVLSPQIITNDPQELLRYHDGQIEKGLEGVVVKKWEAGYDPGRRGYTWVKLKQEEGKKGGGLADTVDCLVMGYNRGKGRRTQFGIGAFLVGVRRGEKVLTVSKIGTGKGLTDEQWMEMHRRCEKVKTKDKPKEYQVSKGVIPDVWCAPGIVVEIEADNITKSPTHSAKYALRFPRLVRFRDDKSPDQATTIKEAEKLFKLQKER
jgi:DNA ligase-1